MEAVRSDMVKIVSVKMVAVILAGVLFLGCPAAFGAESREEIEAFLEAPGAVEIFKGAKGRGAAKSQEQDSPLVKQAQAFGVYLDPPPKPVRQNRTSLGRSRSPATRPAAVTAKFDLIGTCYYASKPEMSLALIKEPAKGLHWVRQGSTVGRLVIEQINDGKATIRDNKRTFELVAKRPPKKSLVRSGPGVEESSDTTGVSSIEVPVEPEAFAGAESIPEISPEESALLDKFFAEMEALEARAESEGSEQDSEAGIALMDELMSELENVRISAEESEKLDDLGEELKEGQQEEVQEEVQKDQVKQSEKIDAKELPPPPK